MEAAEELHYVADLNASRLAAGRTLSVGLLVNNLSKWFMAQVVSGAEAVVAAAGYDVVLYQTEGAAEPRTFLAASAYRKRVDGLVIVVPSPPSELADHLLDGAPPAVTAGVRWPGLASVRVDDRAAAATATRHLVNLGHERIALIGDDPREGNPQAGDRREGYRDALTAAGLRPDPGLDVDGGFTARGGAEAMARLLSAGTLPTAVFSMSDEMALGALRTIRLAGLSIPGDVSLVGFDDHELAGCTELSTIHQPARQIGEVAARLLIERLTAAGSGHDEARSVVLDTRLRVRATTAPCRAVRQPAGAPA
jgi:DNA-binding LacI/PurR family transcriptional regulator